MMMLVVFLVWFSGLVLKVRKLFIEKLDFVDEKKREKKERKKRGKPALNYDDLKITN